MASLRDIRNRIQSVKNTRQITNAMKMVSAAKLRRATEAATNARPYQQRLTETLRRVATASADAEDPLLTPRESVGKILLVVLGTDRGLCGGFNGTLNRRAEDWLAQHRAQGRAIEVMTYGKKPRDFLRARKQPIAESRTGINPPQYTQEATDLASQLSDKFVNGDYDEIWLAFNQFKNTMTQIPTFSKVLPVALETAGTEMPSGPDYKYEPGGPEILGALLPLHLRTMLLQAFLETEAGEQAARMAAMDAATRNASELINDLTLVYNRGRQAAITKELIEIVSGAEAL